MAAGLVSLGKNAGGWANNACEKGEQWQHVLDLFDKKAERKCAKRRYHLQCCHQCLFECEQWQQALDIHHGKDFAK